MGANQAGQARKAGASLAPGPDGAFLVGVLPELKRRRDFVSYLDEQWRAHGDIFSIRFGPILATTVVTPEHLHYMAVRNRSNYVKGRVLRNTRLAFGENLLII